MLSRFQLGAPGDQRGYWTLITILLLAVLIPTVCLLYFINEAVASQRRLAAQQLDDAYRGQLRLVSDRIDAFLQQRAHDLDARPDSASPAVFFEHCVLDHLADSIIALDRDGQPAYPSLASPPLPDPALHDPQWVAARRLEDDRNLDAAAAAYAAIARQRTDATLFARAAQAQIRCLAAAGRKEDALRAIVNLHQTTGLIFTQGLDGRLIAADLVQLALALAPSGSAPNYRQYLFGLAQNYSNPMPSSQRLFAMDALRAVTEGRYRTFPTYQPERLAERVLSAGLAVPGETGLTLSGLGDFWKFTTPARRTLGLYQSQTVFSMLNALLGPSSSFALTPPGGPAPRGGQSIPAGQYLPGWRLSLTAPESAPGTPKTRQIAFYIWTGILAVLAVAILAGAGAQILLRQMRIAHLKTDLVAAVSHELKTPLASMKLLVESLLGGDQLEPQRTRQYLQLIARENSRLSRLIDNFLTFSRMERNRSRFDFARVSPDSIARAALDSIGDRFHVDFHGDSNLPPIYADEDAIVTVLLNLLDNAYKYTGDHGRIELQVSHAAGSIQFTVRDNGIGISERDRKKIFRRFYQVDRRLARQAGGVGLGLSIVEFIVKAHQGSIDVASRPGEGSTFTVSLPVSSTPVAAPV
jgi:signal transduction histidine kinase